MIVVGAGCVGLAVGRGFARAGQSVLVLERHAGFGEETSSRNSEVIHAGLYYPTGSLKARLCLAGRRAVYGYCAARGIRANKCGKLIVAGSDAERPALERLFATGQANGVEGLALLDPGQFQAIEPRLRGVAAIISPESGLFDSHMYMLALLGEIEDGGGALVRQSPFLRAVPLAGGGFSVEVGGTEPTRVTTRQLVLSAGLNATAVGHAVEGLDPRHVPEVRFLKGSYFRYSGPAPFSRLIYPVPAPSGHGVHFTPEPDGQGKFGPDSEIVPTIAYEVDPARKASFLADIRRYWPDIEPDRLSPDYAGIRPKVGRAPGAFEDFWLHGEEVHGLEGLMCLWGIDSPGLTASLALGEEVYTRMRQPAAVAVA